MMKRTAFNDGVQISNHVDLLAWSWPQAGGAGLDTYMGMARHNLFTNSRFRDPSGILVFQALNTYLKTQLKHRSY